MKLFTIGDSASQGFMSGSAAQTHLSFSTLIARSLGLNPGPSYNENFDYFYPNWPNGGMPLDLEKMLRELHKVYGSDIAGFEWLTVLSTINKTMDCSEEYYERGPGRVEDVYPGNVPYFNNVANWGFKVADSWLITPDLCTGEIEKRRSISGGDGRLACANAPFYRSALRVLDPNGERNFSQLDWLRFHGENEGVENLLLWLGMNNAVGPIFSFEILETANDPHNRPYNFPLEKRCSGEWNLWHPGDFEAEYRELLTQVDQAMTQYNRCPQGRVFIGTIPSMTSAPLLKGFGPQVTIPGKGSYYEYYTYMLFDETVLGGRQKLYFSRDSMLYIDDCVDKYNRIILQLVNEKNHMHLTQNNWQPYHIVDICDMMNRAAWQRNDGAPTFPFPQCISRSPNGVDTRYYHADEQGKLCRGGLFSLDGVHPSAIGQGLIAQQFMKVMKEVGVAFTHELAWEGIFKSDSLYMDPIPLMQEIYAHPKLGHFFAKKLQKIITQTASGS